MGNNEDVSQSIIVKRAKDEAKKMRMDKDIQKNRVREIMRNIRSKVNQVKMRYNNDD